MMLSTTNTTRDQSSGHRNPPSVHPRRPPAHLSVSLRHESPASSNCSLNVQPADAETSGAEQEFPEKAGALLPRRQDSDDSNNSGESSSGQQWFNKSNKHGQNMGHDFIDNDSPFFLHQNSSGSEYGPRVPAVNVNNISYHTSRPPVTITSSTDEYRSVIDDLTIENKKLKERLRKYEKTYDAHLERDKLFEVKPHGLLPRKRRELEELLHTFASSIHGSTGGSPLSQDLGRNAREAYARKHRGGKNGSSSSTSNSRPLDSAYASMMTSGPTSTSTTNHSDEKQGLKVPSKAKDPHVESFIQDIPKGLLPKHSPVMTEQSKKKMVVRKLEQLFTGRISSKGTDHSQPLQQQEVSNSAAQADRKAIENRGQMVQAEGVREAHILPMELAETQKLDDPNLSSSDRLHGESATDESPPSDSSLEQRPTRPLDLDPDRAQVPQDNVEYIRHLGLSTPHLITQDSRDVEPDAQGWIYLNLLISMAQLHIINVTPDFVRSAVQDFSTKFQLSRDGRKIRWRGGTDGTKLSSESGESGDSSERQGSPSDSDGFDNRLSKRRKMNGSPRQHIASDQRSKASKFSSVSMDNRPATRSTTEAWAPGQSQNAQSRFAYRPLFKHHSSSTSEDMSFEDDDISRVTYAREEGTGSGSKWGSRSRSASSGKRNHEGTIIYYSGAPFCTDLSGDHGKINTPVHVEAVGRDGFSDHTRDAVGCEESQLPRAAGMKRTVSGSGILFRPFKDYSKGAEFDWDRSKTPELLGDDCDADIEFSPDWSAKENSISVQHMTDMTVSGLGATRPADHFDVCVETRRTILDPPTHQQSSKFSGPGFNAKRFLSRIQKKAKGAYEPERPDTNAKPVKTEIISEHKKDLPPSSLPPPSNLISFFSSSSSEEDSSISSGIAHLSQRTPVLQQVSSLPKQEQNASRFKFEPPTKTTSNTGMEMDLGNSDNSSGDSEGYDDDDDDDDDESIDMLAHLRAVDPDTIAAQEREYEKDRSLSRKRFEEIPAGSSAATIDGGSGFSSEWGSNDSSDL